VFKFFSRKKKTEVVEKIRPNVNYFVNGKDIVFDLNGSDFTFEGFYVNILEDGMYLIVKDEAPMNLILILDVVIDEVGVNRKQVLDSDEVDMILRLDDGLFREIKAEILEKTDVKDIFDIEYDNIKMMRYFSSYFIEEYGTVERRFNVFAKGPLVDAIKKKLRPHSS
jgi:hypothetical protein